MSIISTATSRWSRLCAVLLLPGLLAALVLFDVATLLTLSVTAALMAMLVQSLLGRGVRDPSHDRASLPETLAMLRSSAATGLGVVAAAATVEVSPWAALLLALALVFSSPWMRRRLRPRIVTVHSPPDDDIPDRPDTRAGCRGADEDLDVSRAGVHDRATARGLTNSQLCRAWRASFTELERATTTHQRVRVVVCRQAYLDELHLRDPAALTAWFDAGGRAASGPDRYLNGDPGPRPTTDGDPGVGA